MSDIYTKCEKLADAILARRERKRIHACVEENYRLTGNGNRNHMAGIKSQGLERIERKFSNSAARVLDGSAHQVLHEARMLSRHKETNSDFYIRDFHRDWLFLSQSVHRRDKQVAKDRKRAQKTKSMQNGVE